MGKGTHEWKDCIMSGLSKKKIEVKTYFLVGSLSGLFISGAIDRHITSATAQTSLKELLEWERHDETKLQFFASALAITFDIEMTDTEAEKLMMDSTLGDLVSWITERINNTVSVSLGIATPIHSA